MRQSQKSDPIICIIPQILSPDLLWTLRAIGHGDEIAIVDVKSLQQRLENVFIASMEWWRLRFFEVVVSVLRLGRFVINPALVMEVVDNPNLVPQIVEDFQAIILTEVDNSRILNNLESFKSYDRASSAFAIIEMDKARLYGNIILKKGDWWMIMDVHQYFLQIDRADHHNERCQ